MPALSRWKLGVLAAFAMVFLALIPQISLWSKRAGDWNGSFAGFSSDDEYAYAAYVKSLMEGRPRRNDPYTGRDQYAGAPLPESLFSIQFVPAYTIALPARVLGVSASTSFIVLTCLATFAASMSVFWFLVEVLRNHKIAAAGVIVVLCLGSLAPLQVLLKLPYKFFDPSLSLSGLYIPLGFMRRYVPAVPFPLFFVFCVLIWRVLTSEKRPPVLALSISAGIIFNLLVFSYFYLWTAAATWLFFVALLWAVARPVGWQQALKSLGVIATLSLAGLIPYFLLLLNRAGTMERITALAHTRVPDLLRASELLGLFTLGMLIMGAYRGLILWREPTSLLAAAFALTPLALFNQQILTGQSLQPFHYDACVANYTTLVSAIMAISLVWQNRIKGAAPKIKSRLLWGIALIAFCSALFEIKRTYSWQLGLNAFVDEVIPVATRLGEIAQLWPKTSQESRPIVFTSNILLADSLPLFAPQAVLWAPRMTAFSGADGKEIKERYLQYLYYSGVDESEFRAIAEMNTGFMREMLFTLSRAEPVFTATYEPVRTEEIKQAAEDYNRYVVSFDRERARRPTLSFVIGLSESSSEFNNLDRWYQRDAGERIGRFRLYRVSLRP